MGKRFSLFFAAAAAGFFILPVAACAKEEEEAYSSEGLIYLLNEAKTEYSVSGYTGTQDKLKIPDTHDGLPVTSISGIAGEGVFSSAWDSLEEVKLGANIKSIGESAFYSCSRLYSVIFNDGLLEIGSHAFEKCFALEEISLSDTVTEIGYGAFHHCYSLSRVSLPDSVESIGDYAFADCGQLSYFYTGGAASIGNSAFQNDKKLSSAVLGEGLKKIGGNAFSSCSALTGISFPSALTEIGKGAFSYCEALSLATFAVTDDWFCYIDDSYLTNKYARGLNVSAYILSSDSAAEALKTSYCDYFWHRAGASEEENSAEPNE